MVAGGDAFAQSDQAYTDYNPKYRNWRDDYTIDKIEYTKYRIIFHFRYVSKSGTYNSIIFYPKSGAYPWYLRDKETGKRFPLRAIHNVRRNGELMKEQVIGNSYSLRVLDGRGYTTFTCEIHFDRPPSELTQVDLIEGLGQEHNKNYFNFFDIQLKDKDHPDLGSPEDSAVEIVEKQDQPTNPPPTTVPDSIPKVNVLVAPLKIQPLPKEKSNTKEKAPQ